MTTLKPTQGGKRETQTGTGSETKTEAKSRSESKPRPGQGQGQQQEQAQAPEQKPESTWAQTPEPKPEPLEYTVRQVMAPEDRCRTCTGECLAWLAEGTCKRCARVSIRCSRSGFPIRFPSNGDPCTRTGPTRHRFVRDSIREALTSTESQAATDRFTGSIQSPAQEDASVVAVAEERSLD